MMKRDPATGQWYEESPWTTIRTPTAVYEGLHQFAGDTEHVVYCVEWRDKETLLGPVADMQRQQKPKDQNQHHDDRR